MRPVRPSMLIISACCICALFFPLQSHAMHASGVHAGPGIALHDSLHVNLSAHLSYGVLNGEANELVYDSSWFGREKVSQLIWDIDNVHMAGGVLSLELPGFRRLRANVGVWIPVSEGYGSMVDYDWLYGGSEWSDRSISQADIVSGSMVDLNASAELVALGNVSLRAILGFKYDYLAWEDFNGTYIYSSGGGFRNLTGTFEPETGIEYEQHFYIPYIGGAAELDLGALSLSGYALYSPLVWADDKDYHVLRGIHFEETFSGGTYFAVGGTATLALGSRLFCHGTAHYQAVPEIIGDMLIVESGTSYSDSAGIDQSSTLLTAGLGLRL